MGSGEFLFKGFLPAKGKERKEAVERVCSATCAVVLYEAPHRVLDTLKALAKVDPPSTAQAYITKASNTRASLPVL